MWIECTNSATEAIKIPEIDEKVVFNDSGTAQVSHDVGTALIEHVDGIVESSTDEELEPIFDEPEDDE